MVRRIVYQSLPFILVLLVSAASAQTTHTFTFGLFASDPTYGSPNGCATFQTIDGQPVNQAIGYDGSVCMPYNGNPWWGLIAPQVWGFPNNGYLPQNNNEPSLGPPTFVNPTCNLTTDGCIDYETGSSTFVGYGTGVSVEVTVWFKVHRHYHCGIGGCHTRYTNDETNGSGSATYTP